MDDCRHGMNPEWCAECRGDTGPEASTGRGPVAGSRDTKQDQLNIMCDQLGIPRAKTSNGASLPSPVFAEAARQTGVTGSSMPEIGEKIATKAGLRWGPDCDSRATPSAGGSTVTYEGLTVLNQALSKLLP